MVFLEGALDSKFNPLVHLSKKRTFGLAGFVNKFNAEAELLDNLVSHVRRHRAGYGLIGLLRMTLGQQGVTKCLEGTVPCR